MKKTGMKIVIGVLFVLLAVALEGCKIGCGCPMH